MDCTVTVGLPLLRDSTRSQLLCACVHGAGCVLQCTRTGVREGEGGLAGCHVCSHEYGHRETPRARPPGASTAGTGAAPASGGRRASPVTAAVRAREGEGVSWPCEGAARRAVTSEARIAVKDSREPASAPTTASPRRAPGSASRALAQGWGAATVRGLPRVRVWCAP